MKEKLSTIVNDLFPIINEVNEYIFTHPELSNQEYQSSQYLASLLASYGFQVEYPYLDIPTAFKAEYCRGKGKRIAFLAEYDGLPGYGKDGNEIAHACGHNWIAATSIGAALALTSKDIDFDGTIIVIGTPGEETTGGKCDLASKGAFDDLDGVIQMHLGAKTLINIKLQAMDSIEFIFHGKSSHYAANPEGGINALDASLLMLSGTNALIKHLRGDASIAGIIVEGGIACNIVPEKSIVRYYIRAHDRDYLETITKKVINCAKGACLMTGCTLEYHNFENSFDDLVYDPALQALLKKNLKSLGVDNFTEKKNQNSGSSDIGNVSHIVPTVYCELSVSKIKEVYAHSPEFLDYVHGKNAKETLLIASIAMAQTAYDYNQTK